ncbi:hypothetical protein ACVRXF_02925 [Streptococcus orisasini]
MEWLEKLLRQSLIEVIGCQDKFGHVYPITWGCIPDLLAGENVDIISKKITQALKGS